MDDELLLWGAFSKATIFLLTYTARGRGCTSAAVHPFLPDCRVSLHAVDFFARLLRLDEEAGEEGYSRFCGWESGKLVTFPIDG